MEQPAFPVDEADRLTALHRLQMLDTPAEERFDRITRLACQIFQVPIALVTLVDGQRQWFKSRQGIEVTEAGRDISFCGHAILGDGVFLVADALSDSRFADNPLVVDGPAIRLYAGMPVRAPNGQPVGTLCIADRHPRTLSVHDQETLQGLAGLVEQELANTHLAEALASLRAADRSRTESEERYRRLYAITSTRHRGLPAQVRALIELCCRTLGLPIGLFGRLAGGCFEVIAAVGPGSDGWSGQIVEVPAGAVFPIVQVGEPTYRSDVTEGEFQALPGFAGRRLAGYLGMAIHGSVQRYGTLSFGSETPPERSIDAADLAFVKLVAQWIGGEVERMRAEKRARAHHGVTQVLAEAETIAAAGPAILATLGESLGWDVGALWIWDPLQRRLRCDEVWTTSARQVQPLRESAPGQTIALNEGVAGRAAEWQAPAWIGDVAVKPEGLWTAQTAAAGLHGNLAFPIGIDNVLLGVIEFLSTNIEQPDDEVLAMLAALGSQIGQFQERKRIEEANQLYAEIVRNMQSGLLVYQMDDADDADSFRLIAVNPMAGTLLGKRTGEMLGRTFGAHFPELQQRGMAENFLTVVQTRRGIDLEHLITGEGGELTMALSVTAFAISRERLGITFESILARKRAEGELEQALLTAQAATKAKSEFLANMSHELRTPLNSVIGFSEMLDDGVAGSMNEQQRDFVQTIQRNGLHLLNLINGILDLTKIEAGKLEVSSDSLDIARVCRELVKRLMPQATKKALTLVGPPDQESFPVVADETRVAQVVLNLLSNAIKFTPAGGTVAVQIAGDDESATVSILDSGIGIPLDMQEKVFEAFVQVDASNARQEEGTGLGLHLARQLVELQGGTMWLTSVPDQGSTFSFRLPRHGV